MMVEVLHVVNGTTCTDLFEAEHVSSQVFKDGRAILKFKEGQIFEDDDENGNPVISVQYRQVERILRYR